MAFLSVFAAVFLVNHFSPANFYSRAQLSSVAIDVADGSGSGFIVKRANAEGKQRAFVITADHVMQPALTEAKVKLFVRSPDTLQKSGVIILESRLVARFADIDVAVLLLSTGEDLFRSAEFESHTLLPGDRIFAVGSPHKAEHDNSISEGIVSQVGFNFHEEMRAWTVIDQMTVPVNPGNSGGPVFNESTGRVAGIAVGTEGNGISFFVPVRAIRAAAAGEFQWVVDNVTCPSDAELEHRARDLSYE